MLLARIRIIAIIAVVGAVAAVTLSGSQSSQLNRPWPPGLQKVPADAPVLTPEQALESFYMAPGYRVELVAAEPLVQDPIVMDWDRAGRLWVVEMPGFVPTLNAPEPNMDPIGRVVVLEDTNKDGRMDRRTVFADGLVLARSIKVLEQGVLVAEPPNAWLMKDTNGDLKMDAKELVTNQYGRREARVEQNANEFFWALDNNLYTSESDVFLRFNHGEFELQRTLARGEWGVTQDDAGRIYRNTNESALHVDFVPTHYFFRNPALLRTRGSYEALRDEDNAVNTVWPVRVNPGTNRAYQLGIDREDGSLARFTSVCAPVVYRGDRLPADAYGNVFVAEPAANLVSRLIVEDDGRTLRARKAYDRGEFLASTDERFRPVYLANAPDGTLYIADMYRGVIQQRADITEYLRDYIVSHKLETPIGLGRIYRVVHETTRRDTASATAGTLTSAQLVQRLSHPNGWWRDAAQRMLVERRDRAAAPALTKLAGESKEWRTRLQALWTLDGLGALEPAAVVRALGDSSHEVRAGALRMAEKWLEDAASPVRAAVLAKLEDNDWAVRQQLAASLGSLPADARDGAIATVLSRHGDDPIVVDAALSGIRGAETTVLEKLLQAAAEPTPQREAAAVMLAATVTRGGDAASIDRLFALLGDAARPEWQRAWLLRGTEVAVLGAAMPGTPARRGGPALPAPPCPTCQGARGGPGGAYAFRDPAATPAPAAGRGNRAVRLPGEPAALSRLAAQGGELGTRAAAVLARVEWPGKAGAAPEPAALSPEERARVEAGREVYRNVCQACHQPNGRGMEKIAPSLVDSTLAFGPAEVPVRILLHGKEGSIGLMPPVGQIFTDEQIAAVLTFVRSEFGQSRPVDAATVASVRAATAGRTRPWTNDELAAIAKGAK